MSQCDECARLSTCPMKGNPSVTGCRDFLSHEVYARTLRDEPPNEKKIRGIPAKGVKA